MVKDLEKEFYKVFLKNDNLVKYFSPGRINIIGDHVDNYGGKVLPMAIPLGTYGVFRKNNDSLIRVYSEQFSDDGIIEFDLCKKLIKENNWVDYIKAVLYVLMDHKYNITCGFDLYISSTLPIKSGLSSSASLEMLIIYAISDMYKFNISLLNMVMYTKKAENEYINVKCGIMDQFAIAMGKKGYAMHLNTNTLDNDYIHLDIDGISIIVINSNVKRELLDSSYNKRVEECNKAYNILCRLYEDRLNLCSFTIDELEKVENEFIDKKIYKRAKHVISENYRVEKFITLLYTGKINEIGKIINDSHDSLRDDFEVSCRELDVIVNTLRKQKGCLGARMTGAGFGGCVIAFVYDSELVKIIIEMKTRYKEICNIDPDIFIARSCSGTMKV